MAVAERAYVAKTLRFPPELEAAIRAIAEREDRPFQSQVFRMLREWLEEHEAK